nr:MAG TPA: hypothetical protein [Caudoviricetes sp.]
MPQILPRYFFYFLMGCNVSIINTYIAINIPFVPYQYRLSLTYLHIH